LGGKKSWHNCVGGESVTAIEQHAKESGADTRGGSKGSKKKEQPRRKGRTKSWEKPETKTRHKVRERINQGLKKGENPHLLAGGGGRLEKKQTAGVVAEVKEGKGRSLKDEGVYLRRKSKRPCPSRSFGVQTQEEGDVTEQELAHKTIEEGFRKVQGKKKGGKYLRLGF